MSPTEKTDDRSPTGWCKENLPSAWVAGMPRGQKARVFRWMSSTLALGKKAKASLPEADQSALSKARLIQMRRESSSTGFSPARGRARCKNTWTCTASFPPTRAVSISRKKISRPKAGLSRAKISRCLTARMAGHGADFQAGQRSHGRQGQEIGEKG